MSTLVLIPAYNEEDNILNTCADLEQHCPDMDMLVINDCSRDRTLQLLEDHRINHLNLTVNLGIGGAVQAGYQYARDHGYEIAIQFDGDGQHEAEYLHALIQPILDGEADIAIGSRFIEREGFQSSRTRRMGINLLSRLINLLSGVQVNDVTSGMRAVNRWFIEEYAKHYAQDYPEPEALLYAGLCGARIREVAVQMRERQNGTSSISTMKSAYYMIKVSLSLILERISANREKTGRRVRK